MAHGIAFLKHRALCCNLFAAGLIGTREDLSRMDAVALPLALFVLSIVLNSWKVMCIPPLAILGSVCASLGAMYPFSRFVNCINVVPSVMMARPVLGSWVIYKGPPGLE